MNIVEANKKILDLTRDSVDEAAANTERFSWLNTLIGQIKKEIERGDAHAQSCAKTLADIACYLSDDYANMTDMRREDLDKDLEQLYAAEKKKGGNHG